VSDALDGVESAFYVATDAHGVEHRASEEIRWPLPQDGGEGVEVVAPAGVTLALRRSESLLEVLDELVFVARPGHGVLVVSDPDGTHQVTSAALVRGTAWDGPSAAAFALDCAEHVLGEAATVELPGGHLLGDVLVDARRYLERSVDTDDRLGLLARLATARRLRRAGARLGDVALGLSMEDLRNDLDATLDPAWTTAAAVEDAVLAALEAIRHIALPRYVAAREESAGQQASDVTEPIEPRVWSTAWGPVVTGAEHESPYLPAALAARETALRARETVRSRGGGVAEEAERRYQSELLVSYLEAARPS
jgi:hypothetical protein